ncbi:hypothetical protein [Halodesulfovibrio sp.]|uniref:hypothetical protein n=1 Tax=Halodesulfovibrio sp. TaxID=1912772 RepID=UPI0025B860B7|nr:hypothetical protein [Halodesulfovibrio sp.]
MIVVIFSSLCTGVQLKNERVKVASANMYTQYYRSPVQILCNDIFGKELASSDYMGLLRVAAGAQTKRLLCKREAFYYNGVM